MIATTSRTPRNGAAAARLQGLVGKLRALSEDEKGATAILLALTMPVMVGGMGLGAEAGYWYMTQRKLQQTADVASYAAGVRMQAGDPPAQLDGVASAVAAQAGLSGTGITIDVNTPPLRGAFTSDARAVEVIVTRTVPRLFSSLFVGETPLSLEGRSVVRLSGEHGKGCILALSREAAGAVTVTGSAALSLTGCNIFSNSTQENAFAMPNGSATVSVGCVYTVGGASVHTPNNLDFTVCDEVAEKVPPMADPYADVPEPNDTVCDRSGKTRLENDVTPTRTTPAGTPVMRFCGGVTLKGDVKLAPGLYIIDGNDVDVEFTELGNTKLSGAGVTIYLRNAVLKLNSNVQVTLSAPTTGPYAGILFFGERAVAQEAPLAHTINGSAASNLQGAIYLPNGTLSMLGNASSANGCTQIIAQTVSFSGNATLGQSCSGAGTKDIVTGQRVAFVE